MFSFQQWPYLWLFLTSKSYIKTFGTKITDLTDYKQLSRFIFIYFMSTSGNIGFELWNFKEKKKKLLQYDTQVVQSTSWHNSKEREEGKCFCKSASETLTIVVCKLWNYVVHCKKIKLQNRKFCKKSWPGLFYPMTISKSNRPEFCTAQSFILENQTIPTSLVQVYIAITFSYFVAHPTQHQVHPIIG